MEIALAQMNPTIGSLKLNREKVIACIEKAYHLGASMVVFPEMALCGYPPEDLLLIPSFIEALEKELNTIITASRKIVVILGTVRVNPNGREKRLYNTAAIIQDGQLLGFQDKALLPDYDVFTERRYFEPASEVKVWELLQKRVAVTICEDIWQHAGAAEYTSYLRDPVYDLIDQKPDFLINLSASPYYMGQFDRRFQVCHKTAKTLNCPVLLCNQVGANDSLIFDGASLHVNREGQIVQRASAFKETMLLIDLEKKYLEIEEQSEPIEELYQALVLGIRDYFQKLGFSRACFGLSGGIDSAVVACLAQKALGEKNIVALTLPSRYSSKGSVTDSVELAHHLRMEIQQVSIEAPFQAFLEILVPHFKGMESDITEENLQARIRGVVLMAFSNKFGYLLLSTGNKSEMAMGYATLYGDMCGGMSVLSDVSKQQVYALAHYINRHRKIIPQSILDKPPSAELKPDQKDSDTLPDYALIDSVLYAYLEEYQSIEEIAQKQNLPLMLVKDLVRKIHLNEYKRQQAPIGLRVTKRAFTKGYHFPIVQHWNV